MKRMLSAITKVLKRQRGFTLVEMVTVVAIMGVMAAVAVPMVNTQLGKTREKSYIQDRAMIQTAVDSFFTAADNIRHLGLRQFPLMGSSIRTATRGFDRADSREPWDVAAGNPTPLTSPDNPLRATRGGDPKWRDGDPTTSDGNRKLDGSTGEPDYTDAGEEKLHNDTDTKDDNVGPGWFVDNVQFQGARFSVDSRDYFIDFNLLVDAGLLQDVPESSSPDNGGFPTKDGKPTGSYSWYVKETGQVETLLFFLPSNAEIYVEPDPDVTHDPGTDDGIDTRGFQDGVYP